MSADALHEAVSRGLLGFTRALHARGWPVGVEEQHDALRVAELVGVQDRVRLGQALRALYCGTPEQWRDFDQLFRQYWFPPRPVASRSSAPGGGLQPVAGTGHIDDAGGQPDRPGEDEGGDASPEGSRRGASWQERLGGMDFRHLQDPRESAVLDALMDRLARRWQHRQRRRWRILSRGRRLDFRRTVRSSIAQGGVALKPVWQKPRRQPPRLVLLVDASRSMSLYNYRFLRFAAGGLQAFPGSEAFIFHTHLVRVTAALTEPSPEQMREKLILLSMGWSGGTKIGDSLAMFNRQYGELIRRRSVVVVLSDGLDTGEPAVLEQALSELRRRAGRIIWLNPLMGRAGYAPEARGMKAALPYLDSLQPAHTLDSLLALEHQLARL